MTRVGERRDMTAEIRLTLLEADLDSIEEKLDHIDTRLDVIQRLMISLLVGITLAATSGVINLLLR